MQEAYSHVWRASSALFGEGSGCTRSSLGTFLMFVTGEPPVRGGGGMPQRMVTISVPVSVLRTTGAGQPGNAPRHRRKLSDIAVHAEQARDRFLVRGDRIEIADVDGPHLSGR